jgi:phospholipase C
MGLLTAGLLNNNPNSSNPQRLSPAEAIVCSDSHDYTDEQNAFDHGLMDMFPEHTVDSSCPLGQVVDYFDGNTVTALWNYAQHFAMSDNSFNTAFGPSSPGAVNLASGQTHGVVASLGDISGALSMEPSSAIPTRFTMTAAVLTRLASVARTSAIC